MTKLIAWIAVVIGISVSSQAIAAGGYLYSLNAPGNLSVNGNKINALPSTFDPNLPALMVEQAWEDLAIVDGNQYAIRGDGSIYRNASKLSKLPYDSISRALWTQIEVVSGTTYALRQDGQIAVSGSVVGGVPPGSNTFTSLQVINSATYSLRSDGAVYKNTSSTPIFTFQRGAGLFGRGDGLEDYTVWIELKADAAGQYLYALRTDGRLCSGKISGNSSTNVVLVDSFPFPSSVLDYSLGSLYSDFEFDDMAGDWVVLRVNGEVYRETNALQPTDNFSGSGNTTGEQYFDLATYNGLYFALRSDGKVFVEATTNALLNLGGSAYGRIELSAVAPDLSNQKNIKPGVVQYTIPVNTGLPVKIPVIATDVETPTADLVVTPVIVPTGGVWEATSRTLTWTTPALKGNYKFTYTVADTGSTKTYTSKIQVKDPDLVPEKNYPPYLPKVKGATALVNEEYRLYIPLGDPENDPVTVTVDTTAYPFNAGAIYDSMTSEFVWTPTINDLGKRTVAFSLSDGTITKKLKISIQVNSPLFITPLP